MEQFKPTPTLERARIFEFYPLTINFPWQQRSEEQWKRFVSKEEALRLFGLAKRDYGQEESTNIQWIADYGLNSAYSAYWGENVEELTRDLERSQKENVKYESQTREPDSPDDTPSLFSENGFYLYLLAKRQAHYINVNNRNSPREKPTAAKLADLNENLIEFGLSEEQDQRYEATFQDLVEIYYNLILPKASRWAKRYGDEDEWFSLAGEASGLSVLNFYWETLFVDPIWTLHRFERTLNSSFIPARILSERMAKNSRELYFPVDALPHSGGNPAEITEVRTDPKQLEILRLIEGFTDGERNREVLRLAIFFGLDYKDIADTIGGISRTSISNIVVGFRNYLVKLKKEDQTDLSIPLRTTRTGFFWQDLVENREYYFELLKKRGSELSPARREIARLYLEEMGDDKWQSIVKTARAYSQLSGADSRNISPIHIRKQVKAIFEFLDRKGNRPGSEGRTRARSSQRMKDAQLIRSVRQIPNVWLSIPAERRELLERYYLADRPTAVTQDSLAKLKGVNIATISKQLAWGLSEIKTYLREENEM